ncbi:hypothetical protein [uncultured Chryseobacterium sp.]|uniref:hypothetical protein n=1 Tax=uncultured Chryseobacterium sp. TaxID=259322 RepID=UPI00258451BB|nr:hypothetical protein [uncultured Chryseobacterium sp.]
MDKKETEEKQKLDNILKLISANIAENRLINEEIVRLLKFAPIPAHEFEKINRLMTANKAMQHLLVEAIPS